MSHIFNCQIILFNFNIQSTSQINSTYSELTQNHHDLLSLQRRNPVGSRFWSRLCFYYSKISRPKNNNQLTRKTPSCLAIAVVSKTRLFEKSSSASAISPNQEGTMEMRDEVLSSVGAQDLDTGSYRVSDLEDIKFNWENSQLDMDAVFRLGIDIPFSPTIFDDLSMGVGSIENPIVLDEEEDKENSPPPSTPESERPTEPPRLLRSRPFGTGVENVPESVYRILFR